MLRFWPVKKILVVEDDPVNASMLRDYLEAYDYTITVATNGPAGKNPLKDVL